MQSSRAATHTPWESAGARRIVRRDTPRTLAAGGRADPMRDAVLLELAVQRGLANTQGPGRHQLVTVELLQRSKDGLLFQLGQRKNSGLAIGRGDPQGSCPNVRREVTGLQGWSRTHRGGPFQAVF